MKKRYLISNRPCLNKKEKKERKKKKTVAYCLTTEEN